MSARHTPGPWEYVPGTDNCGPYVSAPLGGDICDCYAMSRPAPGSGHVSRPIWHQDDRADANARLISAAPDLADLAANVAGHDERALEMADARTLRATIREYREQARAALAKARGEQ